MAFHVKGAGAADVIPHVIGNVALGSTINAADHRGHLALDGWYAFSRVNHSRGEYVRGVADTRKVLVFMGSSPALPA